MKLHSDSSALETLLLDISSRTGIRADIIEKDYYVTLILKELADKQKDIPAYFKGGTALYKALGSIRRFSEDIDLTVSVTDCSNSQAKKRLEEKLRIGSELADKPINQFSYLHTGTNNEQFIKEFMRMQEIYVFNDAHTITVSELQKTVETLYTVFNNFGSIMNSYLP
ncbi:MAG: nucleotidyl transferase AbiEii/AbiGii toxin family protein [bacterium]|nr:nucleotidyl transferase AbiEii/AbiGii toxin family protein [bacterium]